MPIKKLRDLLELRMSVIRTLTEAILLRFQNEAKKWVE
jgi:hypothetical protein